MSTDKKIVFITGGNTGIGLEAVKALCQSQIAYEVIIGSRTVSKGEDAITELKKEFPQTISTLSTIQTDLTSDESLEKAIAAISSKHGRLDALINNGGAGFDYEVALGRMTTRDAFNASWDVNVTGTHILTTLAVPLLLKSSDPRLIFLTSGTSSMTDTLRNDPANRANPAVPAGWPKPSNILFVTAYRTSKTGLNMLMREWRRTLLNDGVKVFAVSPGLLATNLAGFGAEKLRQMGAGDPALGGIFLRDVVEGKRDHDEGLVIRRDAIQPF